MSFLFFHGRSVVGYHQNFILRIFCDFLYIHEYSQTFEALISFDPELFMGEIIFIINRKCISTYKALFMCWGLAIETRHNLLGKTEGVAILITMLFLTLKVNIQC